MDAPPVKIVNMENVINGKTDEENKSIPNILMPTDSFHNEEGTLSSHAEDPSTNDIESGTSAITLHLDS